METVYDLAVIGGGASGMAAAVMAAGRGRHVILLEKSAAVGRKIMASGNGRCNLMNTGPLRYRGESAFAQEVISRCGPERQKAFWHRLGLIVSEETEGRVYPCTFQSSSVVDALKMGLKQSGAEVRTGAEVLSCTLSDHQFRIRLSDGSIFSRRLLIASGSPAGKNLGGTDIGPVILRSFGHRTVPFEPSLTPVRTDRVSISGLAGIRVRCSIALMDASGNAIAREKGEALFTEDGVSGICAMQLSRFVDGSGQWIEIDPVGRLFPEEDALYRELQSRQDAFSALDPTALLNGLMLPRLSYAVLKQAGIPLRGERAGDLDDAQIRSIVRTAFHYRLKVMGKRGISDAQVAAGGALCSEFSPESMESRIVPGLYAAGETLNVDGDCGGFNLMFAFASGILAGEHI